MESYFSLLSLINTKMFAIYEEYIQQYKYFGYISQKTLWLFLTAIALALMSFLLLSFYKISDKKLFSIAALFSAGASLLAAMFWMLFVFGYFLSLFMFISIPGLLVIFLLVILACPILLDMFMDAKKETSFNFLTLYMSGVVIIFLGISFNPWDIYGFLIILFLTAATLLPIISSWAWKKIKKPAIN